MKRFSLATLLLLVTVVALSIALFNATSQLTNARAELTKLRNKIRVLDPSDPDKMRAIKVPAPKFVAPELPNDEFMLLINAFEEDGKWMLGVKVESSNRGNGEMKFAIEMQANDSSWLAKRGGNAVNALAGQRETAVNPIDSPFVLLRYRKGLNPAPGVTAMNPKPTGGILIWIESPSDPKQRRTMP